MPNVKRFIGHLPVTVVGAVCATFACGADAVPPGETGRQAQPLNGAHTGDDAPGQPGLAQENGAVYFRGGGCTATLLTSTWMLSAGHCGNGGLVFVGPDHQLPDGGDLLLSPPSPLPAGVAVVQTDQCYMHPLQWSGGIGSSLSDCNLTHASPNPDTWDRDFDFKLYHLSTPVPRAVAHPTPLLLNAPSDLAAPASWAEQRTHVVGWGAIDQATNMGTYVRQQGQAEITAAAPTGLPFAFQETLSSLPSGFAGVLPGDSGGPMRWFRTGASVAPGIPLPREGVIAIASATDGDTSTWAGLVDNPAVGGWINLLLSTCNTSNLSTCGVMSTLPSTATTAPVVPPVSWDGEGADSEDNCPLTWNPWQDDSVGDGIGDACRTCAAANSSPTGCTVTVLCSNEIQIRCALADTNAMRLVMRTSTDGVHYSRSSPGVLTGDEALVTSSAAFPSGTYFVEGCADRTLGSESCESCSPPLTVTVPSLPTCAGSTGSGNHTHCGQPGQAPCRLTH